MKHFRFIHNKNSFQLISKKKLVKNVIIDTTPIEELSKNVADFDKRAFLKVLGIAGLGLAATSLFPKKTDALIIGNQSTSGILGMKDSSNLRINPAKEDGNLLSIKINTDTLVTAAGGGYIRQDSNGTIAKETGGNLSTIASAYTAEGVTPTKGVQLMLDNGTVTNFAQSDESGNLKVNVVAGGNSASSTQIKDASNIIINPTSEESVLYLRRIVKLMESQATVDGANRQRISLDATTITQPVSGSLTTAGTVSTVTSVTNIVTLAGQNQQMYQDVARNAYANGIRQNLSFS